MNTCGAGPAEIFVRIVLLLKKKTLDLKSKVCPFFPLDREEMSSKTGVMSLLLLLAHLGIPRHLMDSIV